MKRITAAILLMAFAQVGRAEWIGPYAISTIEASDSGVYFYVPPGLTSFPNPYGCPNTAWIVYDPSTPLANRVLSMGLAAQAQDKKVKYFVLGCLNGYIKATIIESNSSW